MASHLEFSTFNHLPRCTAQIDRAFPDNEAVNFCSGGRIHLSLDGGTPIQLVGPVVWWTWPGPRFTYGAYPGESWDHYFVTFRAVDGRPDVDIPGLEPSDRPFRHLVRADRMRAAFLELLRELSAYRGSAALARNCLERIGLLAEIDGEAAADRSGGDTERIERLVSLIHEHPDRAWSSETMAGEMNVSEGHLRRLFRNRIGQSPVQFVLGVRMSLAASMLRRYDEGIKAVAARVGIPEVHYFTRVFSKTFGLPPGRYRDAQRLLDGDERSVSSEGGGENRDR
jgi:AraC-like DNA-binding protein